MTFEELDKKLQSSRLITKNGREKVVLTFRTFTLFRNKKGIRLAVRWGFDADASKNEFGGTIDAGSLYESTIDDAFAAMCLDAKNKDSHGDDRRGLVFNV